MEGAKVIQPIVIHERTNSTQRDFVRVANQPLVAKVKENLLTAVTHLDGSYPIDEEIIEMYTTVGRKIMKLMSKSEKDTFDYSDF